MNSEFVIEIRKGLYYRTHRIYGDPMYELTENVDEANKYTNLASGRAQTHKETVFGKFKLLEGIEKEQETGLTRMNILYLYPKTGYDVDVVALDDENYHFLLEAIKNDQVLIPIKTFTNECEFINRDTLKKIKCTDEYR